MQSLRTLAAKAATTAVLGSVALGLFATSAVAGPEWNTAQRASWGACAVVEFTVDATTLPAGVSLGSVQADLREGAALINAAAGRTLVAISDGTVVGDLQADGINTVRFATLRGAAGRAYTTRSTQADGSVRYSDALIEFDAANWTGNTARRNHLNVAHEIGHTLGLGHVADAHEVMSYGFIDDGDGLGEGTAHALRELYPGSGCERTVQLASTDMATPAARATVASAAIGGSATNVRDLAVDVQRYRTMAAGSKTNWASRAVICRDDVFADCLGGSALAGTDGLVLFVPGGANGTLAANDRVIGNLDLLLQAGAPVYVLGGSNAVSDAIVATLSAGRNVIRVAGNDRYATAAAVAGETAKVHGASDVALIARSDNPADAVAAGAIAARKGYPILLTPTGSLHAATRDALSTLGTSTAVVLGGEAAVAPAVASQLAAKGLDVERVAGATRFGTAVAIAKHPLLWNRSTLTDGQGVFGLNGVDAQMWALALAAAPYAASADAPVLLTTATEVPAETAGYLLDLSGTGRARASFIGAGTWADAHAQASFFEYASIR